MALQPNLGDLQRVLDRAEFDLTYPLCGGNSCSSNDKTCQQTCLSRKNPNLNLTSNNAILVCCFINQQLNACVAAGAALSITVGGRQKYICSWCGNAAFKMSKCVCDRARYCSAACQRAHWTLHKPAHQ